VNEHVDEEIGALLDGRLDERRRSELLARLATADEDYDVFADTASVLQEAEGGALEEVPEPDRQVEEAPRTAPVIPLRAEDEASKEVAAVERAAETARTTPVIPLRPRRATGWRSPAVRTLAMAAAVAAIALVPVLRSRTNGGGWQEPGRLAISAADGAPLPAGWTNQRPWSTKRGGGNSAPEDGTATRIGALLVDQEVAARSGDLTAVSQFSLEIAALLEGLPAGGIVAGEYRSIADEPGLRGRALLQRLDDARENVDAVIQDRDYFALGGWIEAALVAATRQKPAFFRTSGSRRALERATTLEPQNGDAVNAAKRLRRVLDQPQVRDWDSVNGDLRTLLREFAK
jgi:hypothetical protein